jgi:hypothetical protein
MPVKTRTQVKYEESATYELDIDFDKSSESWKANKISIGNGSYRYVCAKRGLRNNLCICKCLPGEIYCKVHLKMFKEGKI